MSRIVIEIKTDNSTFEDDNLEYEVISILKDVKSHLLNPYMDSYREYKILFDSNGNRVGFYQFIEE